MGTPDFSPNSKTAPGPGSKSAQPLPGPLSILWSKVSTQTGYTGVSLRQVHAPQQCLKAVLVRSGRRSNPAARSRPGSGERSCETRRPFPVSRFQTRHDLPGFRRAACQDVRARQMPGAIRVLVGPRRVLRPPDSDPSAGRSSEHGSVYGTIVFTIKKCVL